MANELQSGEARHGSIYDGDASTPDIQGALELPKGRILLTVPWPTEESPYAAWFGLHERSHVGPKYQVPKTLMFHDNHGPVILAGCRGVGFSSNFFGPGTGTIEADLAVLGPREILDFKQVNGIVTTLSGLREWSGFTAVTCEQTVGPNILQTSLVAGNGADVEIGDKSNLVFEPRHRLERPSVEHETQWIVHDYVRIRTESSDLAEIDGLLDRHRALRDLLMLSRWKVETLELESVKRNDDPTTTLDGKPHGPAWRRAYLRGHGDQVLPGANRDHLYGFDDIGGTGLLAWFRLRDKYARAIDPILATIDMASVTPSARLAQAGPGIEALGYLLFIDDGLTPGVANRKSLELRLDRILQSVGTAITFETNGWAAAFAQTYNGIKHANRGLPENVELLRAWRDAVNAIRVWVGIELGVDASKLRERLARDRFGQIDWTRRD